MNIKYPDIEPTKSLRILDELSSNESLTQRDISDRLGIALGLVNSYIKNLAIKGFITIKAIPPKRYAYYLTPSGFTEKTRLTYTLLHDYTRIFREARNSYRTLFSDLKQAGKTRIVFAGADEVAEFAYITLQETGLQLAGVVEIDKSADNLFGIPVSTIGAMNDLAYDSIVITTYVRRNIVYNALLDAGIDIANIQKIFKD